MPRDDISEPSPGRVRAVVKALFRTGQPRAPGRIEFPASGLPSHLTGHWDGPTYRKTQRGPPGTHSKTSRHHANSDYRAGDLSPTFFVSKEPLSGTAAHEVLIQVAD